MSDQDPTRPQQPVPGEPPRQEPTSVIRTETEGPPPGRPVPPGPPGGGAVSTGVAIGAALVAALLGLLLGFLIFGGDDDADTDVVQDTVPTDTTDTAELEAERDELAAQVEDLQQQLTEQQEQLDQVTEERDQLQAQLDEQGDPVETVPAPDVTDGTVEDAEAVADENGWVLVERTVAADGEEPGTVVAQYPDEGQAMVEGSVLVVDVAGETDEQ